MSITINGTTGIIADSPATVKASAYLDASGGNTATINGMTPVGTDATQTLTNKTIQGGAITRATAIASTSGSAIDFTGIPSWAKRITVIFAGVSLSGSNWLLVQLGTSSGFTTSGYLSTIQLGSASSTASANAFIVGGGSASRVMSGSMVITSMGTGGIWILTSILKLDTGNVAWGGGDVTISGTVDRVRIASSLADTFDAGTVNIMYEG